MQGVVESVLKQYKVHGTNFLLHSTTKHDGRLTSCKNWK